MALLEDAREKESPTDSKRFIQQSKKENLAYGSNKTNETKLN